MITLNKNIILGVHPLIGEITNSDIINDIDLIIDDYNLLIKLIDHILDLDHNQSELADLILDNDIGNRLANISYILKNLI